MDHNYKPHTWTMNNADAKYTWEIKSKAFNKWPTANTIPGVTVASTSFQFPPAPTENEMIEDVMGRTEDRGFFRDMVDWLRKDAPKRLSVMLKELVSPMHTGPVAYDRLCEVLYQIGFRTSELIERRMILGPSNRWVVEYFNDFPIGSGDE
jgi:hypothetical protein